MWIFNVLFISLSLIGTNCYAGDLFATGWGRSFNSSSEGQLVFLCLQVFGIYTCLKSLRLIYGYHYGTQTRYGYWRCFLVFVAGSILYYPHETLNIFYHSLF